MEVRNSYRIFVISSSFKLQAGLVKSAWDGGNDEVNQRPDMMRVVWHDRTYLQCK